MDILNSLLPTIEHFQTAGYWMAFLFALSETIVGIGLFIPGLTAILIMGAMAAGGGFDIGGLIFFAIFGAVLGDNINYIGLWILPGYFFAQSLNTAKLWLSRTDFFFFFILLLLMLFYILKYTIIKYGQKFLIIMKSLWRSVKQAIIENRKIKAYQAKHPKLLAFLKKRLDKTTFYGRSFTLLAIAFGYALSLFGGVIENFINTDVITAIDIRVSRLLLLFRDAELIKVFLGITILGKWQVALMAVVAAISILWLIKKKNYILPFIITIAGSVFFNYFSKLFFHRPRPEIAVYIEKSYSFPSGHATIAVALYGFLAYILLREAKTWKKKVNVFFAGLLLIFLIGFSRIYLGVHYVSDILSGYLLGALWLIIGISIAEYIFSNKKTAQTQVIARKNKIAAISIFLASLFLYIFFAVSCHPPLSAPPNAQANQILK
ncbi:MAG: phosphatase PAP2 family protein [Patescibacteria group bacterium]